jgi:hypothetical protein
MSAKDGDHVAGSAAPSEPTLTFQAASDGLHVAYDAGGAGEPQSLRMSLRPALSTATVKVIDVRTDKSGTATLAWPEGAGPYVFSAYVVGRSGNSTTVQKSFR